VVCQPDGRRGINALGIWIIVANSWMQTPAGYQIIDGRAELTDFFAAVFNPSTIPRYIHTVDAALITGAFFMIGLSGATWRPDDTSEFAKRSLHTSLNRRICRRRCCQLPLDTYTPCRSRITQPEKLAAFRGAFETQRRAPALLFGISR